MSQSDCAQRQRVDRSDRLNWFWRGSRDATNYLDQQSDSSQGAQVKYLGTQPQESARLKLPECSILRSRGSERGLSIWCVSLLAVVMAGVGESGKTAARFQFSTRSLASLAENAPAPASHRERIHDSSTEGQHHQLRPLLTNRKLLFSRSAGDRQSWMSRSLPDCRPLSLPTSLHSVPEPFSSSSSVQHSDSTRDGYGDQPSRSL